MKRWKKFLIGIGVFVIAIILGIGGIWAYAKLSPKLAINSANGYYLYDKYGNLYTGSNDEWVSIEDISPYLIHATLAIEDKNFYHHPGFDILRIAKAMMVNITSGSRKQGASTITQQYAKNLFLDFDKKWSRKIEEAFLTVRLEAHYSKDEILEGYLNTINYGGIFGIENASKYYFNKKASELTLAEASILAGIPKSPSNYSPLANEEKAKERQKIILNAMVKNNYITEAEKQEAEKTELTYVGIKESDHIKTLMYYQDAVMDELKSLKSIPSSFLTTGGLKIYTNLDMDAQKLMDQKISEKLVDNQEIQIASVMMEPETGNIIAIAGGQDYDKSQFNRVTQAKRQVGSTMKPLLYYAALESGFTASTTFTSEKTTFTFSENKTYSPQNYNEKYGNKPISMAAAIAYSDNIYAVKTHLFLGEETLVNMSKRLGIETALDPLPSLPLGTKELNILEMMQAYAAFANEGYKVTPHFIAKVEDMNGNVLYEFKETKESILNKSTVYILNEMLANSAAKEFIDYNYPTCINIAPKMSRTYAIKTGTTNTDHLIFGYDKDLLMGIWMGYDDNRNSDMSDGTMMKNIWVETMEGYFADKETSWYKTPNNVVGVLVDPISGEPATNDSKNKKIFYYIKGTQPYTSQEELEATIPTVKQQ